MLSGIEADELPGLVLEDAAVAVEDILDEAAAIAPVDGRPPAPHPLVGVGHLQRRLAHLVEGLGLRLDVEAVRLEDVAADPVAVNAGVEGVAHHSSLLLPSPWKYSASLKPNVAWPYSSCIWLVSSVIGSEAVELVVPRRDVVHQHVRRIARLDLRDQLGLEVAAALEAGDRRDLELPAVGLAELRHLGVHEGVVVGVEVVVEQDLQLAIDLGVRLRAGDARGCCRRRRHRGRRRRPGRCRRPTGRRRRGGRAAPPVVAAGPRGPVGAVAAGAASPLQAARTGSAASPAPSTPIRRMNWRRLSRVPAGCRGPSGGSVPGRVRALSTPPVQLLPQHGKMTRAADGRVRAGSDDTGRGASPP